MSKTWLSENEIQVTESVAKTIDLGRLKNELASHRDNLVLTQKCIDELEKMIVS